MVFVAEQTPDNFRPLRSNWTLNLLREVIIELEIVCSIGLETLRRLLKKARLKLNKYKYWKHSNDPNFSEKANRIVELYQNPGDRIVICIDEKTGIQALERTHPDRPSKSGQIGRREFEYKRHGTVNLIASFRVDNGQVYGKCFERNRNEEFGEFLEPLLEVYKDEKISLILDNYGTHKHKNTNKILARYPNAEAVFTPTRASWLNQIEIWFGNLERKLLKNSNYNNKELLVDDIIDFMKEHDALFAHSYNWNFAGF